MDPADRGRLSDLIWSLTPVRNILLGALPGVPRARIGALAEEHIARIEAELQAGNYGDQQEIRKRCERRLSLFGYLGRDRVPGRDEARSHRSLATLRGMILGAKIDALAPLLGPCTVEPAPAGVLDVITETILPMLPDLLLSQHPDLEEYVKRRRGVEELAIKAEFVGSTTSPLAVLLGRRRDEAEVIRDRASRQVAARIKSLRNRVERGDLGSLLDAEVLVREHPGAFPGGLLHDLRERLLQALAALGPGRIVTLEPNWPPPPVDVLAGTDWR